MAIPRGRAQSLLGSQVASAVAVPTIAIFVAAISFFQWRTNKQSLDERLFDRRLKVYHDTKEFILDVRRPGSLLPTKAIWPLRARSTWRASCSMTGSCRVA